MIEKWQAFIQQLTYLIARGYVYYNKTMYPLKKIDRWEQIDLKLSGKYGANLDRFQAYRNNKKGLAKIKIIRWHQICAILHTAGIMPDIEDMDAFSDIRNEPLIVEISEKLSFKVSMIAGHVDVRLIRDCFRRIKFELQENCAHENMPSIINAFNRLNGIPAYRGVIEQKRLLRDFAVAEARRNGKKLSTKYLRIYTRRKMFKVYE